MKRGEWLLLVFNAVYIVAFTTYYVFIRNFEFLWYIFIMIFFFFVIVGLQHKIKFNYTVLWLLSLWGLLHMIGGGVIVGGEVVYKLGLIPLWVTPDFYILKYDQFVHAYLYFVMVFVFWHLIKNHLTKDTSNWLVYPVIALMSIGAGALNEVAEFTAVLAFSETGVGGYFNTAWDIVFNSLGAVLGTVGVHIMRHTKKKAKKNPASK